MTGRREDNSVIHFINLVKAHQCIWNYSIAAYSKTDVTSAAWREIASEIKDTGKCIVYLFIYYVRQVSNQIVILLTHKCKYF